MTTSVWIVLVAGAVGTFLCRGSLIALGERAERLPEGVRRALKYIPPAALSALAAPPILRPGGVVDPLSPTTLAGLAAALVAFRTHSVPWTIASGIAVLAVLRPLLG